jgi:hypothetical protein
LTTSPWTAPCTRRPTAAKAPARTPRIEAIGLEMVRRLRASRHPHRLGDRRRQPQRRPHARTHPRRHRRNTDRRPRHRHAALCLATIVLIVGRLLTWRDRWSPA